MNNISSSEGCFQLSRQISKKRVLTGAGTYAVHDYAMMEYDYSTTHIKAKGSLPVSVGSEQKVLVLREGKKQYLQAYKVKVGDMVGFPIAKGEEFPQWDLDDSVKKYMEDPDFWWTVGRFMADGWRGKDGRVFIAVGPKKLEDLDRLLKFEGTHVCNMHSCKTVTFPRAYYHDFFPQMCGNGADKKHFSEAIFKLPPAYLRQVVDGYLRGDGYYDGKGYQVHTVSRHIAIDLVRAVAKAYGRPAYCYELMVKPTCTIKGKTCRRSIYDYRVKFSIEPRKREVYNKLEDGIMWTKVISVSTPIERLKGPRVVLPDYGSTFVCNNMIMQG